MKKCAHAPTSSEYRSRVWTQASGSIGLSHSHHAVSSGTSDHLFSRICIRGHIQCTELPVSGNQAVDYCPWAQLVQLRTWTPSSPSPCSTGEHEALGGAGACLVGSVAIPGLPALPTLLHNRRPPLGFEQRPVTFYSYWRPLVVKIYIFEALSARPPSALCIGLAKPRWFVDPRDLETHFPIHPGAAFPVQHESKGRNVQTLD